MDQSSLAERKDQPIRRFARFFKAYGLGLSLVIAAVPPIMAWWDLVPMFESTEGALTIRYFQYLL